MPDALTQTIQWSLALLARFAGPIALAVGLYWAYLLYRRAFVSTSDPRVRKSSSSALGSASMLVSGAYASAGFAVLIALVLWVADALTMEFVALLAAGVVFHAAMEYRESMGA